MTLESEVLLGDIDIQDRILVPDLYAFEPSLPHESMIHIPQPAPSPLLHLLPSPDDVLVSTMTVSNGQTAWLPTEVPRQGAEIGRGHHRKNTDESMRQYQTSQHAQSTERLLPERRSSGSPSPPRSARFQRSQTRDCYPSEQSLDHRRHRRVIDHSVIRGVFLSPW